MRQFLTRILVIVACFLLAWAGWIIPKLWR